MQRGLLRELIDPKAAMIEFRVHLGVAGQVAANQMAGSQFARRERVVYPFTREWLDDPASVTDEKKLFMHRRDWRTSEWCDRSPFRILWNCEVRPRPASQVRHIRPATNETDVDLISADRRESAIPLRQKAQRHAFSKLGRFEMSLNGDAFLARGR